MKKYPKAYIAACRARVDADLRAYRSQVGKTPTKEFEARFFNDQVLLLDYMFVHRLSGIEGKDGNPQVDRLPGWPNSAVAGIKLPPEKSVLKLKAGDDVRPSEADFERLSKAFFIELEKKFG